MEPTPLHINQIHPILRLDEAALRCTVERVLSREGKPIKYLGIILTDHGTVRELNKTYRNGDYETDVLAFPMGDNEDSVDGEVYVDLDMALERHEQFHASFEEEASRYVVHGVLHLVGYTDGDEASCEAMRCLEDRYLAQSK